MEDDDEFGDLYADILPPFTTSSSAKPEDEKDPVTQTMSFQGRRQIDLNNIDSEDEEILYGAANSNSDVKSNTNNNSVDSLMKQGTLSLQPEIEKQPDLKGTDSDRSLNWGVKRMEGLAAGGDKGGQLDLGARFLDKSENLILKECSFGGSDFMDEGDIDVVVEERDDKDDDLVEKDENLMGSNENLVGASENHGWEEGKPMIPGVSSIPGVSGEVGDRDDANFGEEEDDSDSDDDLQIVLNNDNDYGPMGMERMGGIGGEEDDEDGDPLVIVADDGNMGHQPMTDDQEWGSEAGAGADGERKELGDVGKVNGGVAVPPKVPYGNQAYHHPFHSQFKYVRPSSAPMPGAAPVGPGATPSQVRPPVNMGPIVGRGRGDWRPAGIKGYGMPVWGNNSSGRGLEFTLPSHKTIFEVDIDSFEEKPWKLPGIDLSNFFNFGLNEESWKDFCKQLEQHRLETTMQSRIRVYESGRTEQVYDPDLPPELAAASGVQDISPDNANLLKADARVRPPLPTGRPIQVETNFTDRLPSMDTRQSRIRDSDAIIEIVCQESSDEGSPEKDTIEQQDQEISREDLKGADEVDDLSQENDSRCDDLSRARYSHKKEFVGKIGHFVYPLHGKMSDDGEGLHHHPGSREQSPANSGRNSGVAYEERKIKGSPRDTSPRKASRESPRDKQFIDNQKDEESYESIDRKRSPLSSSAFAVDAAEERDVENKVTIRDESLQADSSSEKEIEGLAVDVTTQDDMLKDKNLFHSSEQQKVISRVEQPSQEIDSGEDSKAAKSSENSKARSASSKDYKSRDGFEEEVVQDGRSEHIGHINRSIRRDENIIQRKAYHARKETERHYTSAKGVEESYSRKGREPILMNNLRVKTDITGRRRENVKTERALPRNDEDLHGRRARVEDTRRRDHADDIGPRHRNKVQEDERSGKDERYQLREHLDNGSRRGNHDNDMGSNHRDRDDSLKRRYENMDYPHNKRRKEDTFQRREQGGKGEIVHVHRESSSFHKRERDDVSDQWKRDDQARVRDDDMNNVKLKEGPFQRKKGERQRDHNEWHRSNQSHEETLSKREREEGRSAMKSIRASEERVWSSHSRGKEEYKVYGRESHSKDAGWQNEQPKRKNRLENESLAQQKGREDVYVRVNQHGNDERRLRHERAFVREDRTANDSENHKVHERKHKEFSRKGKESEVGDRKSPALSRRNQDEYSSGQISEMQRSSENEARVNHELSKKQNEEVSSDDEHSLSVKGRSKMERWTSHKEERDVSMNTKSSSSLQIKEVAAHNSIGRSGEPSKPVENKQRPARKDKNVPETNHVEVKLVESKHLDTVEKLKKRSERFKLPLPSEKEAMTTKKIENVLPPSTQNENHPDTEIKPERPARKRRWTNN